MQARRAALLKLNESYDGLGDAMATDPTEIPVDFLRAQPLLAVQMAARVVAPGRMQEVVRVASIVCCFGAARHGNVLAFG